MSITETRNYEQLNSKLPINMFVRKYLQDGKKKGNEWISLNPTRSDSKQGSFSVNLTTGVWKEFAGDGAGGNDMISLYAYINRCSQSQAYDELSQIYAHSTVIPKSTKPKEDEGTVIYPAPLDAGSPPEDNRAMEFCYRNENNQVLLYVFRYNNADGTKRSTPPCTYRQFQDGSKRWHKKGIDDHPKPFYHIPELLERPQARVILVEGEKATLAAERLMPDWVATCWHGGSNNSDKADYSYLKDRDVILWPDNDDAGIKAMNTALSKLKPIAKSVRCIDVRYIASKEKGWDLADGEVEGITYDDIMELIDMSEETPEFIDRDSFPLKTAKGNPINAYENMEHLFKFYKIDATFNIIRKEVVLNIPHKSFTAANKAKLEIAELNALCIKNGVPRTDIIPWVTMIADKHSFNPVEQFILSKPWDGISRINEFMNTIQCSDNKVRDIYMYRWMLGAIAVGLCKKGLAHPGVLTFISKQAKGKSSWVQKLVPKELNLILSEFILNPDDKDSVIRATKYWIVELAEADATVNKSEANSQKAFLTRETDQYRCPYDRTDTEAPRHTCFAGTVNDAQFLKDTTGNRRWWVLDVIAINYKHTLDMQQVWAEFKTLLDKGEQFHLTDDELDTLMEQNEAYRPATAIEEAIRLRYDWDSNFRNRRFTAIQVLEDCGFDTKQNKNNLSKEANRVLRELCDEKPKKVDGLFCYYLPSQRPYV